MKAYVNSPRLRSLGDQSHLKYLLSLILPCCVLWFLSTGPHNVTEALLWTTPLWLLIVLDWLSPKINSEIETQVVSSRFYDTILYVLAGLQLLIIYLLLVYANQLQWNSTQEIVTSVVNLVILRILVGTTSGSSALIVAHEFIHRPSRFQRILGRLLLYTVCYEHFVIAHIRGHHYSVATPADVATAHIDESYQSYWKRVYPGHFKYAWNSELKRLGLTQAPVYHYKMLSNSVLQGLIIECTLLTVILVEFGWAAAFIFLYQALAGIRLLEAINYYQHWGLDQKRTGNTLAWVNQSCISKYALIGLSHHIGHHQNAGASYQQIPYLEHGPIMPYGYFVTNLWVKLNNESYRRVSSDILANYCNSPGD